MFTITVRPDDDLPRVKHDQGFGDAANIFIFHEDIGFRAAIEELQCDEGLNVDGVCARHAQPRPQQTLTEVHGC